MTNCPAIGNQTSVTARTPFEPFEFARSAGFTAFEWFADKKWDGPGGAPRGWEEPDLDAGQRAWIRSAGKGMRYTVHAPWQANPLHAEGPALLLRSVAFAADIGAELVNLHLYPERGAEAYVAALAPVLRAARSAGIAVSIENTPETTPEDFVRCFDRLRAVGLAEGVGLCLDIGHANLCHTTRCDYIGWVDRLGNAVPITHAHLHENWGDRDSHLTLFTGPSARNDAGLRALLSRLRARRYRGVLILEQWPSPTDLLTTAAHRIRELWASL